MLMSADFPVVIVGIGPVGDRLMRELVRCAPQIPILTYDYEPWNPYDRTNLVAVLTGELSWADLENLVPIPEDSDVTLRRTMIVAIDRAKRTVTDLYGRQQPYSTLVLATGSEVHVPDIPGTHLAGVSVFRHKCDVAELLTKQGEDRRIAVLGGGILGVELACGLRSKGAEVCVVQPERLMSRQLDDKASAMVLEGLRARD
ncbi:MAG: FAD-dependent oxidoreductase [Gammaproteobacteria bacterium]